MNGGDDRLPVAEWLRGERYGIRAIDMSDAAVADVWHDGPEREEGAVRAWIAHQQRIPWGNDPTIRMVIVDMTTGHVRGGMIVERHGTFLADLTVTARVDAEERSAVLNETMPMLVRWVAEELRITSVRCDALDDDSPLIDALRKHGFREAVRLREHALSADGRRGDRLILEWSRGNPA